MNPASLLFNLLISIVLASVGFWLKGLDSFAARIGGWLLFAFGALGVYHAAKWLWHMRNGMKMQRENPQLAAALDKAISGANLTQAESDEIARRVRPSVSSGATYEQATNDYKMEVERLMNEYPDKTMGEIFANAAEIIKKRHPQFDATNQ